MSARTSLLLVLLLGVSACSQSESPTGATTSMRTQTQGQDPRHPDQVRMLEAKVEGLTDALRDKEAEIKRLRETSRAGGAGPYEFRNRPGESFYAGGAVLFARDPATGDLGWMAVSICPAAAGQMVVGDREHGAVAVLGVPDFALQAKVHASLRGGASAQAAVAQHLPDPLQYRNLYLAAFGADGTSATFLGLGVHKNFGSGQGKECFALGCEIISPDLPQILCDEYEKRSDLPMPDRLLAAMREARLAPLRAPKGVAGISNSGVDRPILSAALVMLRPEGSLDGTTDRMVDVRVDLDAEPIAALEYAYRAWERASLVSRLKTFLKGNRKPDDPRVARDRAWLERLRVGG